MNNDQQTGSLIKIDSKTLAVISKDFITIKAFDEDILALESTVAGTSHLSLGEIEKKLEVDVSELKLEREPKNEYDGFAVKILFEGQKIGYIPRSKNQTIARLMDAGKQFYAKAIKKSWEGTWLKIDITVYLKD